MSEKLKPNQLYTNIVKIASPICGTVDVGEIGTGEKWERVLVYPIGNCGISALFKEVDNPIKKKSKKAKNLV